MAGGHHGGVGQGLALEELLLHPLEGVPQEGLEGQGTVRGLGRVTAPWVW